MFQRQFKLVPVTTSGDVENAIGHDPSFAVDGRSALMRVEITL
jgi:hypothetical protein